MNFVTAKAALYVGCQGNFTEIRQVALDYCQGHDYSLEYIYQDTGSSQPILQSVREMMEERAFHLLLIPSVEHIYENQLGQLLNFLIDAQEAHVDIVCLTPTPTNLYTQALAIVPQSMEQTTNLDDIVRCLRYR